MSVRGLPLGHHLIDAGALDQAIEQDHQGPLILVRELIDLLIEAVQFGVMNRGLVVGLRPPGQFVETDIQAERLTSSLCLR